MKRSKGITLIALIITIIVLLILAGVSISMVVGENGVLTQATNASEKTGDADMETVLKVALAGLQGDYTGVWNENNNLVFLDCIIDNTITLKSDGYEITLGELPTEEFDENAFRTIKNCRIYKENNKGEKVGSEYLFDLVEDSMYSAEIENLRRN